MYPEIPLPPKPILTRWGTWLEAVEYYAEHIDSINNVLLALDSEDAVSIDTAKTVTCDISVKNDLAHIQHTFSCIIKTLKSLQNRHLSLSESFEIINSTVEQLNRGRGKVADAVRAKVDTVLSKNPGYEELQKVVAVMSGESTVKINLDLSPADIVKLNYVPVTSCDVERSFSQYKSILRDNRRRFTFQHLKEMFVTYCYVHINPFPGNNNSNANDDNNSNNNNDSDNSNSNNNDNNIDNDNNNSINNNDDNDNNNSNNNDNNSSNNNDNNNINDMVGRSVDVILDVCVKELNSLMYIVRITYMQEKLPTKYGVHSEEYLPIRTSKTPAATSDEEKAIQAMKVKSEVYSKKKIDEKQIMKKSKISVFNGELPHENNIRRWNRQLKETGSLLEKNRIDRHDETVEAIRRAFLQSPKKSVRKCVRQLGLPKITVHRALTPYKLQ
ncbi:hypothetical protein ANN_03812 [Periplaneta americana]|uniref:Uncharacterized protein n=1 Tax=Periplaneta americana TaxID=6978 RepID=A0ABQ8TZZ8_PERAM|nr:hypothetical protein ANN_03812 [Periplaneta americana]